ILRGFAIPAGKERCALAGTGCSSHNFAGGGRGGGSEDYLHTWARDSQVVLLRLEGFGKSLQQVWPTTMCTCLDF
ncbi:unnamed protein product, partial [Ectocarpus sp. 8 AP-2014]